MILKPLRIISNNLDDDEEEAILLSPSSRIFHEPTYNVYVLFIMGWKVPIEVDSIKAEIQSKMLKYPRFSSLQVMDESEEMRWVPTRVNINDHVIVPQITDNNMDNDELVEDYMSNLSTTTIDISKPLWDFHILNVKTCHAEATSILRTHHSIGDGAALMSIILSCFRTTSDPTCLPTLSASYSSSKDKSNVSINKKYWWQYYIVKLWYLIKLFLNTVVDVLLFIATALFLKDSQSPFTSTQGFNASARRRYVYRTVSLDDIQFIKDVTNATVNDVVLGITQAALSRYIHRRYGKRKFSLQRMRCRATVIVNLRPALGVQAKGEMIEKNAPGNCFGFVLVPLSIGQLDNPLDYVHKTKKSMERKKHSLEYLYTFYASQLFQKFFGYKGAAKLAQRVPSQITLVLSNVIGPREEISCVGHPLAFIAPTCYGYTGTVVHVCSHANKLTFAITVDDGIIPDLKQFGDDFIDSFMLIKEAAHLTKWGTKLD